MRYNMRCTLGRVSAVIAIFSGVMLIFALWPTQTRPITADHGAASDSDQTAVERGRYLAVASDCTACHTKDGGQPFAGGLPMSTPIGIVYSTNITPDRENGIGAYSLDDFERAVRHGITTRGITLYPAMPYPSYARITDSDIVSLYAYFMHGAMAGGEAHQTAPRIFPGRCQCAGPWPSTAQTIRASHDGL